MATGGEMHAGHRSDFTVEKSRETLELLGERRAP